jgi:voltage-gated potassium channel
MKGPRAAGRHQERERWHLLLQLERILEAPLLVLSFVWLALLIVDFVSGLSPFLQRISNFIWALFVVDFAAELLVAPAKLRYLRRNWLTALALLLPALRIFRLFRAVRILRISRAARGLRLTRVLTSFNRGVKALRHALGRRKFGYVLALTLIVNLLGAAGMYALEKDVPDPAGLHDFGTALWWTAMMLTTMGSQYWPQTPEGRLLGLLLATYAFAIFGYITATIASFFMGSDGTGAKEEAAAGDEIVELREELRDLRLELRFLRERNH